MPCALRIASNTVGKHGTASADRCLALVFVVVAFLDLAAQRVVARPFHFSAHVDADSGDTPQDAHTPADRARRP